VIALVTDGRSRVALAVVRALGQAGVRVAVVEQERFAGRAPAAFRSRYVRRCGVLPSLEDENAFIEALAREARGVDVILPVSTNVLMACVRNAGRLPARLPAPPLETVRRANDKWAVQEVARRAGVPVPASAADLEGAIARLRCPAVVKLRDDEGTELDPADRYAVCRTPGELRERYREFERIRPSPVVQEFVEGDGYGVGVIAKDGRVLASLCYRREREYPVSGGPSSLCVTVRDGRLAGYAASIIRELGWTGAAMVEFRKGDDYRLMEVNPRFWGGLPLATRAGINFPHLLCRMAVGEEFPPVTDYPGGIRLRFLTMDVPAALAAVADPSRRGRYVAGFLRDLLDPGIGDGILDPRDLGGSLAYLWDRLLTFLRRRIVNSTGGRR